MTILASRRSGAPRIEGLRPGWFWVQGLGCDVSTNLRFERGLKGVGAVKRRGLQFVFRVLAFVGVRSFRPYLYPQTMQNPQSEREPVLQNGASSLKPSQP